jgi:hypothetical protein
MKKLLEVCIVFLFCSTLFAQQPPVNKPGEEVSMLVQGEIWATSSTAKVTARINAVLNKTGLDQVHKTVMQKLVTLSNKGTWHLTSFNRSQDKSGLEQVEILAEARLPESDLAGIRDRAKQVSRPGETYTIDDIDFHPGMGDIEAARSQLRTKIYEQAKVELANLNKAFPDKHFSLQVINFMPDYFYAGVDVTQPTAKAMLMSIPQSSARLATSDKVQLAAVLVLSTSK